jgi:hypothetical protein
VKWAKSKAKEGEEVELTAQVKDIADGNPVTFQVWREGQDVASGIAGVRISKPVEGGAARAKFTYNLPGHEELPEKDPKFFFTAHSAWCPYKQSDNVTVELKRPELSEARWLDRDGNAVEKGLVGEALKLSVSCNADMEEGAGVIFRVYAEGADPKKDKPVVKLDSENREGKAATEWVYHAPKPEKVTRENPAAAYYRDVLGLAVDTRMTERYIADYKEPFESKIDKNPRFFFTVSAQRAKEQEASVLELTSAVELVIEDSFGNPVKRVTVNLIGPDGQELSKETDDEGKIILEEAIPGRYNIHHRIEAEG